MLIGLPPGLAPFRYLHTITRFLPRHTDHSTILRNLPRNGVVSPQALAPASLLDQFPSRPDFARAHPLGPPVSTAKTHDPFVRYGFSPLDSPMNPYVPAEYCTSMGKIKQRGKTGLQRKSQRQMGKAVRRARVRDTAISQTLLSPAELLS